MESKHAAPGSHPESRTAGQVYISYNQSDGAELARWLEKELTAASYVVLMPSTTDSLSADTEREIEQGIEHAKAVLVLLTEGSFNAPHCRNERAYARDKHKLIIPLLAQVNAPIPLILQGRHYLDFSTPDCWPNSFKQLREKIEESLKEDETPPSWLPELPKHYVPREEPLRQLRSAVLDENQATPAPVTILQGKPGAGKTVLATALAHEAAVHEAFPNGIVWVQLGGTPDDLAETFKAVGRQLGDVAGNYVTPELAQTALRDILPGRKQLIVLEDAYTRMQAEEYLVDAPQCHWLITTTNDELSDSLDAAAPVVLAGMTPAEAVALLVLAAGRSDPAFREMPEKLDYWPTALALVGQKLARDPGLTADAWLERYASVEEAFNAVCDNLPAGRWLAEKKLINLLQQRCGLKDRALTRCIAELSGLGLIQRKPAAHTIWLPHSRTDL